MSQNKPNPALERLDVFVGSWKTEGIIMEVETEPAKILKASDKYEWLAGGFFLIHHVDGYMGDEEIKTIEIIGYDDASQSFFTHSYDNYGTVGAYQANLLDRKWIINGKTERFNGSFNDDGTILSGKWELSSDGSNWAPWMEIKLVKEK